MTAKGFPAWLDHLRRDSRGIPVPYVNRWGAAEDPARIRVAYDYGVKGWGVFYDDTDETIPDFTTQNMGRQRECMLAGLCQVCGKTIPDGERYLVLSTISTATIDIDGTPHVVVTEPWLDHRCAILATTRCPALIRRHRMHDLTLIPIGHRHLDLAVSTGWVDGPLEELSRTLMPALWVKILAPTNGDR
jgi:hypothetical protein